MSAQHAGLCNLPAVQHCTLDQICDNCMWQPLCVFSWRSTCQVIKLDCMLEHLGRVVVTEPAITRAKQLIKP